MSTLASSFVAIMLILGGQVQGEDPKPLATADNVKELDGFWSGAWGGGDSNGVVFQPVIAEMLISGEKFELIGFRNLTEGWGLVRVDRVTKKLQITTAKTADSPSKVLKYTYKVSDAHLTLTDSDNVAIELHKIPLETNPLVKVRLDILIAEGINEEGRLLTIEQSSVKIGRSSLMRYQASTVARKIDDSAIFVTEENDAKKISVDEARKLLKPSTPVAMAYREMDEQTLKWDIGLRHFQGSAKPDSESGLRTLARSLRPGTLVFVVSELQATPEP